VLTKTFDNSFAPRFQTDFRNAYFYLVPDLDSTLYIVGQRAMFWRDTDYEWPAPDYGGNPIYDEINYWTFKDGTLSDKTGLRKIAPGPIVAAPHTFINGSGDVFRDRDGFVHVIYEFASDESGGAAHTWYAVLKDGETVSNEFFKEGMHSCRFAEDTEGNLYLLTIEWEQAELLLYNVAADRKIVLSRQYDLKDYGVDGLTYGGMAVAAPRNGATPADYVDCVYSDTSGEKWVYFRLQLK